MNRYENLAPVLLAMALVACSNGGPPATAEPTLSPPTPPPDPTGGDSPWTYKACESMAPGSSDPGSAADVSPAGIWDGILTNELLKQTEPYTAIVALDGEIRLLSTGHAQFAGTLEVRGSDYTGTGIAESGGTLWQDGNNLSDLTVAGRIVERDSLRGDWLLASGDAGCFVFEYDAGRYEQPSSLDLVSGTWIADDAWGEFMRWPVQPDGSFASVDTYGCSYTGRFTLIDPDRNLYAVDVRTEPTNADSYCLSPGPFSGLAWIGNTATSPDDDTLALSLVSESDTWRVYFGR